MNGQFIAGRKPKESGKKRAEQHRITFYSNIWSVLIKPKLSKFNNPLPATLNYICVRLILPSSAVTPVSLISTDSIPHQPHLYVFLVVKQLGKQVNIFNIIFAHTINSKRYPIAISSKKITYQNFQWNLNNLNPLNPLNPLSPYSLLGNPISFFHFFHFSFLFSLIHFPLSLISYLLFLILYPLSTTPNLKTIQGYTRPYMTIKHLTKLSLSPWVPE